MKPTEAQSLELVRLCCRALDEKKAGDLRVLDVRALSSITDYLVIGTATSEPHVRALRVELEKALDSVKTRIIGFETARESGWAVMDAFDVMVHIFTPEKRDRYRLENLWRDALDVPLKDLMAEPKRIARKAVRAGKKAPGKTAKLRRK
ncbi:MAG TPA: ribosome silencing factor [Opitutaceae bacterium]|nr:ribosome silencing factor [Opitutaceae bacterium]